MEVDVCVVGAGYAGLTAARRLAAEGRTVCVLEARDRVGGRIWTEPLDDGTPVDRGGAWLAPQHDAALALAREVGVDTYKTWVAGNHLLVDGDRMRRYTGLIPKISPLAVVSIAVTQVNLDRLARKLPMDEPWAAAKAAAWDEQTVGDYVRSTRISSGIGRALFEMAVRGLFAADLDEVSFLHLLALVRGHGSINTLFSIEGGSQENLVDGGAGSVAARVANELGDAVVLGAPVRSIAERDGRVVVTAAGTTVTAGYAVVAIPPALVLGIEFEPGLSSDRVGLYRAAVGGRETKTLVVYREPFWRTDGFSGQTAGPGSAAEVTIDASPNAGAPGVLASFTFGPVAERLEAMTAADRRRAVVDALVARLGPKARDVEAFVETAWWTEPWSLGCSMAHLPPGALTQWGPLLRAPVGRIHWAGTETATVSHGAIDGAIRSGERAAAEVLART